MSSVPQTPSAARIPLNKNEAVMGHQGFVSVVLRSIGGELYKIRRRRMSKVLVIIGILYAILSFAVLMLPALIASNDAAETFLPPPCTASVRSDATSPCLDHKPTAQDLAQAEQIRQKEIHDDTAPLRLPLSFNTARGVASFIGFFLIVTLAGSIIGGEYATGTIRLMLTRGLTRSQFLLAKLGALLVWSGLMFLILMPVGIITGALLTLAIPGIPVDFGFLTGMWVLHALLYVLVATLGLFVYAVVALCFSLLGRTVVAGVAGAIVWLVLEVILGTAFQLAAAANRGWLANFLKAIPDYFIGTNVSAALDNQAQYLSGNQPTSSTSDLHAVAVLVVYLVVFLGVAWLVHLRRDVTN